MSLKLITVRKPPQSLPFQITFEYCAVPHPHRRSRGCDIDGVLKLKIRKPAREANWKGEASSK